MSGDPRKRSLRVALVVPHIFVCDGIRENVIFSPGELALALAKGLENSGINVTLCTPGAVKCGVKNITADMSGFERELRGRGYGYMELLKKHPYTFIGLARQMQAELVSGVYERANDGEFDVVHIYTNEEDIALQFANLCQKPVVFTHHDPYNFLIKYKSVFPRYKHLNFVSVSMAQRKTMPDGTNWVGNIYHGVDLRAYEPRYGNLEEKDEYFAYLGRIIEPKGIHKAIEAAKRCEMKLKIAGKHYADGGKDQYWDEVIEPELDELVEYVGYLKDEKKLEFLRGAKALIVPSVFDEPFGMVTIEALACGTPVIGSDAGATPEIIEDGRNGFIASTVEEIAKAMKQISSIERRECRKSLEEKFTLSEMLKEHIELYERLIR